MSRILSVLVLFIFGGLVQAAQKGSCGQELLGEPALLITPDGDVYIEATLGTQPVYFRLSTTSGLPLVIEESAHALGLTLRPMNGSGTFRSGDQRVTHFVSLEGLSLDGYRLLKRAAPVMLPQQVQDQPLTLEGHVVAGVLGSDIFRNVDVELLLGEGKLRLYRSVKCTRGRLVDWQDDAARMALRFDQAGTMLFNLELGDQVVESTLLSGHASSVLDRGLAVRFLGLDPEDDGRSMSLTVRGNGLHLADMQALLRPGPACKLVVRRPVHGGIGYECLNIVPFQLGTEVLAQMRVYISREQKAVLIAPLPSASPASESPAR